MKDVRYTIKREQKPTAEQISMIERAKKLPITYDEDSPEISEEINPELYAAMMQAVAERNQRVEHRNRALA